MGKKESAHFSLWLPMNKDIFGFDGCSNAPLNVLHDIFENTKSTHEFTLFIFLKEKLGNLKFNSIIDSYEYKGKSEKFDYSRGIEFEINNTSGTIGTFQIFSNGLYLWNFNEEIKHEDFILHLEFLFESNYDFFQKNSKYNKSKIHLKNYNGILNYFQIELLLNALYDINIAPSYYFGKNEFSESVKDKMSFSNILKSILLYKSDDELKAFSVERDVFKILETSTQYNIYFKSSMEQFIRVANTYSLEHYKRGLDFCLKQLSTHGMMRVYNGHDSTNHFIPLSLNKVQSSIAILEAYQTLIFEKLPLIKYLNSLFKDLSKIVKDKDNITLNQAIQQNSRRIELIKTYFENVKDSLFIENQKKIQYELSEIRKYTEMSNEMIVNDNNQLQQTIIENNKRNIDKIMLFVAGITFFITLVSPIISYMVTNGDNTFIRALNNIGLSWQGTLIIILWSIAAFISYILYKIVFKDQFLLEQDTIYSRYIFDTAIPNQVENDTSKFMDLINLFNKHNFNESIPSVYNLDNLIKCIKLDTLQEKFNTFKLYKFSFYSEEEENIKYILHIDIEFDLYSKKSIIEDIRIVVLKNNHCTLDMSQIYLNAKKIKGKFKEIINDELNL